MRYDHDSAYVAEILRAMPRDLSQEEFRHRCRYRIYAGWQAEVIEAERRYFEPIQLP